MMGSPRWRIAGLAEAAEVASAVELAIAGLFRNVPGIVGVAGWWIYHSSFSSVLPYFTDSFCLG